jgi:hypothetical protein
MNEYTRSAKTRPRSIDCAGMRRTPSPRAIMRRHRDQPRPDQTHPIAEIAGIDQPAGASLAARFDPFARHESNESRSKPERTRKPQPA